MASIATIRPTTNNIDLNPGENSVVSFTVTNVFGAALNIAARIRTQDSSIDSWISIKPPIEKEFSDQTSHLFTVEVNIPQNSQPGQYEFSMLVYSVTNPNLDFSESDPIVIEVPEPEVPSEDPPSQDQCHCQKKYFILTVLTMIVLALIVAITQRCSESDVVTLSGKQTITGSKTFSVPIKLSSDGRAIKSIILPAHQAYHGSGVARSLFMDSVPSIHFLTSGSNAFGGETSFVIPIPDDIDINSGVHFRLVWGFSGNPEPSGIIFNWRVGAQFFQANNSIAHAPFQFVQVPVSEVNSRRGDVLVTQYMELDQTVKLTPASRIGVMNVSIPDPGTPIPEVYLLQVELKYVANRFGKER